VQFYNKILTATLRLEGYQVNNLLIKWRVIYLLIFAIVLIGSLYIDRQSPFFLILLISAIILIILTTVNEINNNQSKNIYKYEFEALAKMISGGNNTRNPYYDSAFLLLKKGYIKAALEKLEEAIEFDPDDADPLALYGTLLMWNVTWPYHLWESHNQDILNQKLGKIESYFKRALKLDKNHFMANVNIGVLYSECRDFKRAYSHFEYAIKMHPAMPIARQQYGIALVRNEKFTKGLQFYKEEKALFGMSTQLAFSLGEFYSHFGKLKLSELYLKYAIERHPGCNYVAHQRYARIVALRGDFKKAFKSKFILAVGFSRVLYLKNLGRIFLEFVSFYSAFYFFLLIVKIFRATKSGSIESKKTNNWATSIISAPYAATFKTMLNHKYYGEALAAAKKSILIDPRQFRLYAYIIILYQWREDSNSAIYWARRFCIIYKNEYLSWYNLANLQLRYNSIEKARESAKRALALMPEKINIKIKLNMQNIINGEFSLKFREPTIIEFDEKKRIYRIWKKNKDPIERSLK
jgi:tetratricopeptide (TPR) repeat protein